MPSWLKFSLRRRLSAFSRPSWTGTRPWSGEKNEACETVLWELDPRPGGKWRSVSREKHPSGKFNVSQFDHWGEVLEIDPPRLLVYTWFANFHEPSSHRTVVRWELTRVGDGTQLKVTHSGLAQLDAPRNAYSQGWPGLIDNIRKYVEKV
jgi:uncharacterized protein YndB with AHSA1/START domain